MPNSESVLYILAFDREDFEECKRRAHVCLQTMSNYTEDDIADKRDVVARIHSILGNTHLELGEYEEAQEHHEKDLSIGEEWWVAVSSAATDYIDFSDVTREM